MAAHKLSGRRFRVRHSGHQRQAASLLCRLVHKDASKRSPHVPGVPTACGSYTAGALYGIVPTMERPCARRALKGGASISGMQCISHSMRPAAGRGFGELGAMPHVWENRRERS